MTEQRQPVDDPDRHVWEAMGAFGGVVPERPEPGVGRYRRWRRSKVVVISSAGALGLVVALVVILMTSGGSAAPFKAHGTEDVSVGILDGQSATDAYPGITDGTQVVVTDATGTVIGTGSLAETNFSDLDETFSFTVSVPSGESRYGIQVGGANHGTVWFTERQMRQGPALCLGDGC